MDTDTLPPATPIDAQTRVGELLTRWPGSVEILLQAGLAPLSDPAHREMVKSLPVTLGMACSMHGLDLENLLSRLNAAQTGMNRT